MQRDIKHFASPSFWNCYKKLPKEIQRLADKNFELLKSNQEHPSLHFKKADNYCSVRIGRKYRALGV
jgi:mRNA-degrading endonuclease RelE of RelBE toxin-antitoxin system